MFAQGLDWLREAGNAEFIRRGLRGVEREALRVDSGGRLSRAPHPRALGAALTHPYLTTDYSEALLEFVTPAYPANWEVLQFLCDIHVFAQRRLEAELLWAASMPCVIDPQQKIPIADYGPSNLGMMKTIYRRGLGHRYGRAMQAIAGVHFNFSLPEAFWAAYREGFASGDGLDRCISASYMGLVRNYRRHAWLVIYLFGASPAVCKSFCPDGHAGLRSFDADTWYTPFATSLRMSDLGYRNKSQASLTISANSLSEYVAGLAAAVGTPDPRYAGIGVRVDGEYRQLSPNVLQIENEYYSSIRPKPKKGGLLRPTVALLSSGVEYVEVRTLDANPTDPVGINQNQMRFLEALLIFCLLSESPPIDQREQQEIDTRELLVAREGRRPGLLLPKAGGTVPFLPWALELLDRVAEVAAWLDDGQGNYTAAVQTQREALADAEATPSAQLLRGMREAGAGFFDYALELSRAHREYLLSLAADADKQALLQRLAQDSLRDAAALEASQQPSFEAFLAAYFAGA